ncbi:unnamed protein product, partial [Musa hybrid cultivar]
GSRRKVAPVPKCVTKIGATFTETRIPCKRTEEQEKRRTSAGDKQRSMYLLR